MGALMLEHFHLLFYFYNPQENTQLRTLLKQYLDGISVNDEILSQVNPLFVVNHKSNVK